MSKTPQRVLIFIVAYNAEETIAQVLDRIVIDQEGREVEVLIIDDASRDATFEIGLGLKERSPFALTVYKNPTNQGYGGNQKLGYHYAIAHGFDAVVLLHGDGQYAPEKLGELVEPILAGEAEAVFGSRMLHRGGALRGGMPLYKFVGNKILTTFQNVVLGQELSEYHSGYRVYSTTALSRVPFEFNSNDFHFDTEIIIQFLAAEQRILELPIPTFYGDEISHVNGFRYAWDVVRSTLGFWLHQRGIFYRYNFDIPGQGEDYELKLGYASSHSRAIDRVPPDSKVVDLGCGTGGLARILEEEKGCEVLGVDRLEGVDLANYRQLHLERDSLPEELATADVVLLLDVLETLGDPEAFLFRLRRRLPAGRCRVVLTTPNIAFGITRFMLLFGQLNYGKRGILDKKHRRLFTFSSLKRLMTQAGFVVERVEGIPAPFPKALREGGLSSLLLALNRLGIALWKRLFSYQILLEATPLATVENLIAKTERHSQALADETPP